MKFVIKNFLYDNYSYSTSCQKCHAGTYMYVIAVYVHNLVCIHTPDLCTRIHVGDFLGCRGMFTLAT